MIINRIISYEHLGINSLDDKLMQIKQYEKNATTFISLKNY